MSPVIQPALEDVLEAFMLDADDEGVLARYLSDYPQYRAELLDLAHQMEAVVPDELPPLDQPCRDAIARGWERLRAAWPAGERNLFADLSPTDYGRVASELSVPRQVLAAIRDGRILAETIPGRFMQQLAQSLRGTLGELGASIGAGAALSPSYKSDERPQRSAPISFEQALIEARVPEEERQRLLADDQ
jgi:hypothetical protein